MFDIDSAYNNCIKYLNSLIQIPSSSGEESTIAVFINGELTKIGIDVRKILTSDGRITLLGSIGVAEKGKILMLAGHIDTVSPDAGWTTDPYKLISKQTDKKSYALGACDMKAGLAVMLAAASAVFGHKEKLNGRLLFAFMPDEEAYSIGVDALVKERVCANFCLMPEPHYNPAIIGAPGKLLLKISFQGKSAHGARPREGINAIEELSLLISYLQKYNRDIVVNQKKQQPFVTLSVKGGSEKYSLTVPDKSVAIISKQLVIGENKDIVIDTVDTICRSLPIEGHYSIEVIPPYYSPYSINTDQWEVKLAQRIYKTVTGEELQLNFGQSVSDANVLCNDLQIPTLLLGPKGGNMHQPDEWIELDSVRYTLEIYLKYINEYLIRTE